MADTKMTSINNQELSRQSAQNADQRTSDDTNPNNNNSRQIKKRNRIPLSCNACRRRKLRWGERHSILTADAIVQTHVQLVSKEVTPTDVNLLSLRSHNCISLSKRVILIVENRDLRDLDREIFFNNEYFGWRLW